MRDFSNKTINYITGIDKNHFFDFNIKNKEKFYHYVDTYLYFMVPTCSIFLINKFPWLHKMFFINVTLVEQYDDKSVLVIFKKYGNVYYKTRFR